jgi:hypothetical protein
VRISQNRYAKDLRRRTLATRMIRYEARTRTIAAWSGLTKYQIQALFREYTEFGEHPRHRGVSPYQPAFFSRTLWHECESAALAALELEMGIIPAKTLPEADCLPGLARGERLLAAFDHFRSVVAQPKISFEHAVLLASELAVGRKLALRRCSGCGGLMVVDRLGPLHENCAFCRLDERDPREIEPAAQAIHPRKSTQA